ncbi:MAG TPA: glycosyltransferase [Roseiflexaceae bacterium]|jgi:rhamnosyl/mannosyltransferase
MHILQLYKDYFPVLGGIENHVRDLSTALAARGHQVTVLTTSLDRRTLIERPRPGLTVIKAARTLHLASTPISPEMLRQIRRLRADIVHLHFPYPPGDLAYLAMPARAPLVVTYHSDIVRQQALLRVYRPLLEWTLRRAARIIATSPNYVVSSPWLRRYATKCAVVPLGIDAARYAQADEQKVAEIRARYRASVVNSPGFVAVDPDHQPSDNRQPTTDNGLLLFVGRLRYYKGLHVLLDALPLVPARLLIGGSGPERERLEARSEALGVAGRVQFLGDIPDDDLPALYHAADVFVLPAHLRAEALGLSQIEALASGVACVSTELGTGTSYANRHGETGLVVPPGDPAALAQAINTLLADPELRRRMGVAGRRRVAELFTREAMVAGNEAVYREVVVSGSE